MKIVNLFLPVFTAVFFTAGCNSQPKPFTDKKIIVRSKETVKISELDLSITNNGCGRKWISEGDSPAFEKPYCELIIKRKDSVIHAGGDYKPVYIGNVQITIDRMNPWGREEDSVPAGGCRLWVRRIEGR